MAINCAVLVETLPEAELFASRERNMTASAAASRQVPRSTLMVVSLFSMSPDLSLTAQAKLPASHSGLLAVGTSSHRCNAWISSHRRGDPIAVLRTWWDWKTVLRRPFYRLLLGGVDIRIPHCVLR